MQANQNLCIAIFGPTASGKTKPGDAIAKTFRASILTAKPTVQEIDNVPHHMVDYLEADEEPHDFVAMAADKMEEVTNRGKLPILVGGSTSLAIPLLHEALKREYRFIAATLIPRQSTYWQFIQVKASEMLERGLLGELEELRDLQQSLLDDNACFHKGVWKAIGGGSSSGNDPKHIQAAKNLAFALHSNNYKLIYGGGTTGIMGAIASTLVQLSSPSTVHGIIPVALAKYEEKLTKKNADPSKFGSRTVVKDMHTRKRLMIDAVIGGAPGSGFVALSGGYGTLEELLETTTWYQLGIHQCGICVFDVCRFYKGLIDWVDQAAQAGFVGTEDVDILRIATTAEEVIGYLGSQKMGVIREWVSLSGIRCLLMGTEG
ncbi:hypothetical protein FOZG_10225 [Fusarium oxysporum Fo47]|uniref:Lysine decarboxylase n=1 Tax=Fusarium oxysporum Fo47 TaxID=660027 RepID=W9K7G0_FUSOX|nr:hypothetical protein FOZG_10225 [Fusarium oxysporum Fo47]